MIAGKLIGGALRGGRNYAAEMRKIQAEAKRESAAAQKHFKEAFGKSWPNVTQDAGSIFRGGHVDQADLRALTRALKQLDDELPKELRRAFKADVAEPIASAVSAAVPVGSRNRSGHRRPWKDAITAGATQRSAYVTWGRATTPGAGWLEFGGDRRTRSGGVDSSRPYVKGGRFVYPTVQRHQPRAEEAAARAIDTVSRKAGLD